MWRWMLVVAIGCTPAQAPPPSSTEPGQPHAARAKGRVVVTDTQIEFLAPIRWVGQSAEVTIESLRTLDAMVETINGNPELELVEITAYGNDGAAEFQQLIGQRRAQAIVDYLVQHGVAAHRVRAKGIARSAGGNLGPEFLVVQRK